MTKYFNKLRKIICSVLGHKWHKDLQPNHIIRMTCTRCGDVVNVTTELTFKNFNKSKDLTL